MRRLGIAALAVGLGVACGRTPFGAEEQRDDTGPATTGTDDAPTVGPEPEPTDEPPPEDTETEPEPEPTDDPPTTDTGMEPEPEPDLPPPATCRDVLDCITECLLSGDFECALGCGENADSDQQQAAFDLMFCVLGGCVERDQCSITMLDMDCLTCVGIGLIAPQPTGCEAEAEACQ